MRDLKSALDVARSDLRNAEESAAAIPRLREEVRGLELALARQNGHHLDSEQTESSVGSDWTDLTRPEAIKAAMRESTRALAPNDIRLICAAHGRQDTVRYISATLTIMKKRGDVRRTGYGKWTLPKIGTAQAQG
jgi:hypothetical protein